MLRQGEETFLKSLNSDVTTSQLCLGSKPQFWSIPPFMRCLDINAIVVFIPVPKMDQSLFSPPQLSTWIVYSGQINLILFSGAWQVEKWRGEELSFHTGDKAKGTRAGLPGRCPLPVYTPTVSRAPYAVGKGLGPKLSTLLPAHPPEKNFTGAQCSRLSVAGEGKQVV